MKRTTLIIAAAGASVLALGCSLRAPKTQVSADDFDIAPLMGKWSGDYSRDETGRSGDISFTLRAAEGAASGYIEMLAREPDTIGADLAHIPTGGRWKVMRAKRFARSALPHLLPLRTSFDPPLDTRQSVEG